MIKFYFLLIVSLLFFSCSKKEYEPSPIDFSYFPLQVGDTTIYFVEKIHIDDPINIHDTERYYLKEIIESTYYDETGNLIYRIERYKRSDTLANWELTDVWMAQYYQNQVHKVEENIRYVKLVFPLKKQSSWDGNAFNTFNKQIYSIAEIDVAWQVFPKTCLVVQQNKESLVDKYFQSERYAQNVGLIEKIDIQISQAYIIIGVPIEQRIRRGDIYRQVIIN